MTTEPIYDALYPTKTLALKQAKKSVSWGPYNNIQLCYYLDDDLHYNDDKLPQVIPYPKTDAVKALINSNLRLPLSISNDLYRTSSDRARKISHEIKLAQLERENLLLKTKEKISKLHRENREKPLILILVGRHESVVRRVYEQLHSELLNMRHNSVLIVNNAMEEMDDLRRSKEILRNNPDIVININRVRNDILAPHMTNIAWFQDPTLMLYDGTSFNQRKSDHFFWLIPQFHDALIAKGINRSEYQGFATNRSLFFKSKNHKRKRNVVYIGSDYLKVVSPTKEYANSSKIIYTLTDLFKNNTLTTTTIKALAEKFVREGILRREEHLELHILPAVIRREIVKWLCSIEDINVEIYGSGWDDIPEISPFWKGVIPYEEVGNIYRESTYTLIDHPQYYYQQRLLEASACGCIPIVYQYINNREKFYHQDNVLLFNSKEELIEATKRIPPKPVEQIAMDRNFDDFIKKIIQKWDISKEY